MYSRLLRVFVSENEFAAKALLRRKYCRLFTGRLPFENCSLLQNRKGFDLREHLSNIKQSCLLKKYFSSNNQTEKEFEQACNETLESLCEYLEHIVEDSPQLDNPDVTLNDGVLTLQLGEPYGTYVINRQTPNKQIWLSSPTSGPKRYDLKCSKWIYKHDGVSLHELLTSELSQILSVDVNFSKCVFGGASCK